MARKKTKVFAETAEPKKDGKLDAKYAEQKARIERLVGNEDFKAWFFELMLQLCSFGDSLIQLDDFHQGMRAAGAFARRSLLVVDKGAGFLTDINKRYYDGLHRWISEAEQKTTQAERG